MELHISDDRKIVEIWLTRQDKRDQPLQKQLEFLCRQYEKKQYFVAVFQSGDQDLAAETSALLCYNRKQLAAREIRRGRARAPQEAGARQIL